MEITDTSQMATPERIAALVIAGGSQGEIEAMEAAGQSELVLSDCIPTQTMYCTDDDLVALGFTLGAALPNDPLFRAASLPDGWSKRATDHDMWSEIVDEHGTVRVSMFYKAAFYDRRAHLFIKSNEEN